jgi:hypothetical protein
MRANFSDVTVILDRSGSMAAVADDTVGGFNTFLKDQQAAPGEAVLTVVQFDTEYEFVHRARPIRDVPLLTRRTFQPRGNTALLDAIGRAVIETGRRLEQMPEAERPSQVIVVVLTDGQENSSHEFTRDQVFRMIEHQRTVYNWTFLFLGANQDAIVEAGGLGIPAGAALTYAADSSGTARAYAAAARLTRAARSGSTDVEFTDEEREEQRRPDDPGAGA